MNAGTEVSFWQNFRLQSRCLPEKATKRFKDFVGKILEFKCSRGDVWHVGLIRSGDKLVLEPGWNNFASSNNVIQNDILLFQLVSGSTFEVRIFNSGVEKCDDFEGEAYDDKVQEGIMSPYSSKINGTSAKPHSRKRSRSQNHNSLPLRKQLKKSNCGSHCQEKEKTACKEVRKVLSEEREEFLESEGKYEISPPVKNMNRQEEETLEEARNSGLLVIEYQAHLGRKSGLLENGTSETMTLTKINGTSAKPHSRKRSRSQNRNSLPLRKRLKKSDCGSLCQEKEKAACEEVHKLLSEEREEFLESEGKYEISPPVKNMNRQEKETLEEARNNGLLLIVVCRLIMCTVAHGVGKQ
ncbi:B3 domain-containing protein [Carex littledalei]|uniref:B3 domain-containing protein n=1 Tax=Carex littledalei TaxID=544730 RepID=A0A833VN41_9POAL|nr:B3 domain-containing protein [Carex littledalei]